jgi:hypothetical protein
MKKVITYQAPNGSTINLTTRQIAALEKASQWPRNASGEYCTVSHGLHAGEPTCDTNLVSDLLAL